MIGVRCIICDKFCELDNGERNAWDNGWQVIKVCDDCKKAIEWLKKFKTFERD